MENSPIRVLFFSESGPKFVLTKVLIAANDIGQDHLKSIVRGVRLLAKKKTSPYIKFLKLAIL